MDIYGRSSMAPVEVDNGVEKTINILNTVSLR